MTDRFSVDRIARLAVLGAGTMGHGIAHVAALAGLEVSVQAIHVAGGVHRANGTSAAPLNATRVRARSWRS